MTDFLRTNLLTPYLNKMAPLFKDTLSEYEDVDLEKEPLPALPEREFMDYCKHRNDHPTKLEDSRPKLVRVKSKLNKAWRSVKNWINEDKEHASKAPPEPQKELEVDQNEATYSCVSEYSDYFSERSKPSAEDCGSDTYTDILSKSSEILEAGKTILRRKRDGVDKNGTFRKSRHFPEGQNGFEELRRYIKQGEDFCKELSVILQERSEVETQYAKSLSKLSAKLLKTSRETFSGVAETWQRIGAEMESQSDIHRVFANALAEDCVKPLRNLVDNQHRIRKQIEGGVDKTGKSLSEWRQAESKSKKQSFLSARENEKLQDAMLEIRTSRNNSMSGAHYANQKQMTDKESAKLETKRKKAEDGVKKADVEYYTYCVRAERARVEWETAVTRGANCFQNLEEERLTNLKNLALCYLNNLSDVGPRITQCCERLKEPVESNDPLRDLQTLISLKGSGSPPHEQLLPDFYAEHVTLAMNRDRRKQALSKLLQLIREDIERERRGKQGVENLQRAMLETPTFGGEESQNDVDDKLYHMKAMLVYLEATRHKIQSALCELEGNARPMHPLAAHIHVTRDRQGFQQSVLKLPDWAHDQLIDQDKIEAGDQWIGDDGHGRREAGDGNSVLPDSDFDEFSSEGGSDKEYQTSVYQDPIITEVDSIPNLGTCRALYPYKAKLYDELNLEIGDIIQIREKQPDGWWMGELKGIVGIFPATYVEEV